MEEMEEIIDSVFPFLYLTQLEKKLLLNKAKKVDYPLGTVICSTNDYGDYLFILCHGHVFVNINDRKVGEIRAPAYFGELAVLFQQKRKADIIAASNVTCLLVEGVFLQKLLWNNISFRYAFANILRHKQQILNPYQTFLTILFNKKNEGTFSLSDLLPYYLNLWPILHTFCNENIIDFSALSYVVPHLPENITSINTILLSQHFPNHYQKILTSKAHLYKKNLQIFHELFPGKLLVLLRDEDTDYIDILTKLCVYTIESKKIAQKMLQKPTLMAALKTYYLQNELEVKDKDIIKLLPFSS